MQTKCAFPLRTRMTETYMNDDFYGKETFYMLYRMHVSALLTDRNLLHWKKIVGFDSKR